MRRLVPIAVSVLAAATVLAIVFSPHRTVEVTVTTPTPAPTMASTKWTATPPLQTLPFSAFEAHLRSVGGNAMTEVDWLNTFEPLPCYHSAYWEYRLDVTGIVSGVREYIDKDVNIENILALAHC